MIKFCKTTLGQEEKDAISKVIDSGWVAMGDITKEFETKFADYVGAKYAVFVDSGTSALDLSIQWLKLTRQFFRMVRVPSITFTSTAESLIHAGIEPLFVDVNLNDLCMEYVNDISLPVHLMGERAKDGALIYDSAHRIEKNDVKGSPALWCYSFYATKNITTVQGGMIALNDGEAYNWLKLARDHGMLSGTKERYEGKWKYDIEFIGWRKKPDDVRAAMGLEQLKKLPWITERRNEIVDMYNEAFDYQRKGNHLYSLLVDKRDEFMNILKEKGIQTSIHFIPLHTLKAYKNYQPQHSLKNTEWLKDRMVSLPLYPQLTNEEVNYIIDTALETKLILCTSQLWD